MYGQKCKQKKKNVKFVKWVCSLLFLTEKRRIFAFVMFENPFDALPAAWLLPESWPVIGAMFLLSFLAGFAAAYAMFHFLGKRRKR